MAKCVGCFTIPIDVKLRLESKAKEESKTQSIIVCEALREFLK